MSSSAGVNVQQSGQVRTGTQAYLAFYNPATRRLLDRNNLVTDASGNVSISAVANWDASCVLTGTAGGPTCPATGAASLAAQAPTARTILSWSGTTGIPFVGQSDDGRHGPADDFGRGRYTPINANRLYFLRGERINEINTLGTGLYRIRDSVLGDIVDSSPTWVGPPLGPIRSSGRIACPARDSTPRIPGADLSAVHQLTNKRV